MAPRPLTHRFFLVVAATLGLVTLLAAPPTAAAAPGWGWPVRGPVLTRFDVGPDPFARGQRRGITIGAPAGSTVGSACRGTVRFAGTVADAGQTVSVACAGGLTATYLHLGGLAVHRGRRVAVGESIGTLGRSGRPALAASHLQFGVHRTGKRWAYVDPLSLLDGPAGWSPPFAAIPVRGPGPATVPPGRGAPWLGRAPWPARAVHALAAGTSPTDRVPVSESGAAVPVIVWAGAALLVLALPGWGLGRPARRRRRAAQRISDPRPGTGRPII